MSTYSKELKARSQKPPYLFTALFTAGGCNLNVLSKDEGISKMRYILTVHTSHFIVPGSGPSFQHPANAAPKRQQVVDQTARFWSSTLEARAEFPPLGWRPIPTPNAVAMWAVKYWLSNKYERNICY